MKKPVVIHPFLVGLFPILFLLARNEDMVSFSQILLPSAVVLGFTGLATLLLTAVLGDGGKAGIVVSIFLILFFSYGRVVDLVGAVVESQLGSSLSHPYLLLAWAILFILLGYAAVRIRDPRRWTSILNIVAIALIAPSVAQVGVYQLRAKGSDRVPPSLGVAQSVRTAQVEEADEDPPDIYYIILDRYASNSTLQEYFGVDNSEFTDYLTSKGFYVAAESRANYPKTFLSLASSLNMKHLTYLTDELGRETSARTPVYPMLQDYEVWRFLKSRGYKFIHFGSSWEPTRRNRYADLSVTEDPAEFPMMLYETTALGPLGVELNALDARMMKRQAILRKLRGLADLPDTKGPKFVFAHLLLPHAPYLFGPQGEIVTEEQEKARSYAENYLNQLAFTNEKVEELVDQILSRSDRPPVIILQSDEGPFIPFLHEFGAAGTDWRKLSDPALRTHMRILNAYYLPNADPEEILYPSVTPVNSFRIIFDHYFGTDYGLVEDESYIFEDTLHPYTFINVTDRVTYR